MKRSIQLNGRQGVVVPTAAKRSGKSRLSHRSTASRGFSLVELLVVITIIGMLVGLLMPALISARGRARIAQCTNNQKELGLAIIQYEGAKQKLPGYANQITNGTAYTKVSWVPVLFPYLGRMDLWEGNTASSIKGWRTGDPTGTATSPGVKPRLAQVICPNGSPGVVSPDTPLSYVVNVGYALPTADTAAAAIGLFRTLYTGTATVATNSINLSSIKSPARRPMISERNNTITVSSTSDALRSWSNTTVADVNPTRLGFIWPIATGTPLNSTTVDVLPAIHQGIVIVTFCDGHTESLADNTDCSTFDNTAIQ